MKSRNSIAVWNTLTGLYDGHKHEMNYDEAENVEIAWPPILEFMRKYARTGSRVLDYGCGTGGFACHLGRHGYNVVGIDPAEMMIRAATQNAKDNVRFITGDAHVMESEGQFDVLSAVMVFQFVEDLDATFCDLRRSLVPKSSIILAVFNPEWVLQCLRGGYDEEYRFSGFDDPEHPEKGFMDFGKNGTAPLFLRNAGEYDAAMEKIGFSKKMECMPPFTDEFLRKYRRPGPVDIPEFLILGYVRSG